MISEDVIQRIKNENDIVDIISESLKLKKAGRNFIGLCPFHHEKSPSFSVSPDKQIYKCFGCGEAGNVINFVMKTRNMTFIDAIMLLAEKANIEVVNEGNEKNNSQIKINEHLYKLNIDAARFFFYNLKNNKTVVNYFTGRGISENTISRFGLGYACNEWNTLLKHLKSKGYSELDMLEGGLIIKSEKGTFYDRFRNRVIFPVFNYSGKVIGFGGRVLDDSKPKYLNSPETAIFKKGINLYGLNFAIKNQNRDRTFIIVEGYMDCISLHQFGIPNVVASLGTALTINQAKLLKKYADKVIIAYDADSAGQIATLRGLEILKNQGFDLRVLIVPKGKDPDEFIRNNGKDAFYQLINDSLPLVDYRLKKAKEGVMLNNSEGIIQYAENALEIIQELHPVERDVYIKKIAEETKIKEQAIYDLMNKNMQKNVKNDNDMNIENNFGRKLYLEPAYVKAERALLKIMLNKKESLEYIEENFNYDLMVLDAHKKIYTYIVEILNLSDKDRNEKIELKCSDLESSKEWINILDTELMCEEDNIKSFIDDLIKEIRKFKLEESKKEIMNKIKQFEAQGKFKETLELANELVKINKMLGGMK